MSISKNWAQRKQLPGSLLLGLLVLLTQPFGASAQKDDPFKQALSYLNNNRLGERLTVSYPQGEGDLAKSTEMTLSEEAYFNNLSGRFDRRLIAVVTGMGLGNTGLKLVLDDTRQINDLEACLKRFVEVQEEFRANEDLIREKTEAWMGESWNALSKGREIGTVYFYPSKKVLSAEFMWDFELDRVWLSIGSRIMVEQGVVPYILRFIQNAGDYRKAFYDYRKALVAKNREIDDLLGLDPQS